MDAFYIFHSQREGWHLLGVVVHKGSLVQETTMMSMFRCKFQSEEMLLMLHVVQIMSQFLQNEPPLCERKFCIFISICQQIGFYDIIYLLLDSFTNLYCPKYSLIQWYVSIHLDEIIYLYCGHFCYLNIVLERVGASLKFY